MPKQYVFWRAPTGTPYKGTGDQHAPAAVLAELGQTASVTSEKGISWPLDSGFHQNRAVACGAAVVIDPDGNGLNESDARSIIWKAIAGVIRKQGGGRAIPPKDVLAHANRIAASHFRKRAADYVLVTSLSVESLPAKRIRMSGCEMAALAERGSRYLLPDALKSRSGDDLLAMHLKSTEYITVRVKTAGRSIHEAADRALDAVNLLRGLWTLFATYGTWTFRFGKTREDPIGVIHTGPVHTLHRPDGSPAENIFWFEPHYAGDRKLFRPKSGWPKLDKLRDWAVRRMSRLGHRQDLERLVMRYAQALDQSNLDVAFLQMWAILEKMTDTVGANYDETIRRAIWPFKDRQVAKETLEHLRFRRNQYVHAARSGQGRDQIVYMVKSFVDPHLVRLIRNDFEVESLAEYGEFLGLPAAMGTLEKRRDQLKRAIRLRKK